MTGALFLIALLCTSVGLLLSFAPRSALLPGLALVAASAGAVLLTEYVPFSERQALTAAAVSIAVTALAALIPGAGRAPLALLLSANAGLWAGALASLSLQPVFVAALSLALLALPGRWIVERGYAIVLKVVSGWLIAIGVLAAALPMITTPGYVPDHME